MLILTHQVLSLFSGSDVVPSDQNLSLFRNKVTVDKVVKIQVLLSRSGSPNPVGMVSLEKGEFELRHAHRENLT